MDLTRNPIKKASFCQQPHFTFRFGVLALGYKIFLIPCLVYLK